MQSVLSWMLSNSDQADSSPSFLWLLRDHHLHMRLSAKEEMVQTLDEEALKTLRRHGNAGSYGISNDCYLLGKMKHRPCIRIICFFFSFPFRSSFATFDCMRLSQPAATTEQLQELNQLQFSDVSLPTL